jgi:hypothetical protein
MTVREQKRVILLPLRPAVGEIFTLTTSGGLFWNDPMNMLEADGYEPETWRFAGKMIKGIPTLHFTLETVSSCSNIDDVLVAIGGMAKAPEGQWRNAFASSYRLESLRERLGVPDPSWIDQYGYRYFPSLSNQQSLFHEADDIRRGGEGWLWLVKV